MEYDVIVLGAGYAGLRAVTLLAKNEKLKILVIDKNKYHTTKIKLHEVAAGYKPKEDVIEDISLKLKAFSNVEFVVDEVVKIDKELNEIICLNNGKYKFKYAICALGFKSETFNIEGVDENAFSIVDVDDACIINEHIKRELELYKSDKDKKHLSFIVIGGGFTGVELASLLQDELDLNKDKYGYDIKDVNVSIIEAAPRITCMFSEEMSIKAKEYMESRGIDIYLNSAVKKINVGEVVYVNEELEKSLKANTIIWTSGVSGNAVIEESGLVSKRSRALVNSDLTILDSDNIFAVGDDAFIINKDNDMPCPQNTVTAFSSGTIAANNILAKIEGNEVSEFKMGLNNIICTLGLYKKISKINGIESFVDIN